MEGNGHAQIPDFDSLDEFQEFWATHEVTEFEDQMREVESTEAKVRVEAPEATRTKEQPNPLRGIIGLGKAGRSDGAEEHDRYLYDSE